MCYGKLSTEGSEKSAEAAEISQGGKASASDPSATLDRKSVV